MRESRARYRNVIADDTGTFVYMIIISSINRINHLWRFHFPRNSRGIDSPTDTDVVLRSRNGKSLKIQLRFSWRHARTFFPNIRESSLCNWLSWRNCTLVNRINQSTSIGTCQEPTEIDSMYAERLNVIAPKLGWITHERFDVWNFRNERLLSNAILLHY